MAHAVVSRRALFRSACCGALTLAGGLALKTARAAESKKTTLTPDQALDRLKKGNADFISDKATVSPQGHDRRMELARSQAPFAVLVGCSDSRVSPSLLFDVGLGELFIVRNAGNTVDTVALGSVEYAVAMLGVPLVAVLGHERCGAVDAALGVVEKGTTLPGSLGQMIEPIIPAALQAKRSGASDPEALLDAAVRENVRRVVTRLRNSEPVLLEPLRSGKLRIVGARYDLDNGAVDFFIE